MFKNRSFKMKVYLDELFSRKTSNTKKHWVGTTFRSFAVIAAKSGNFNLSICPDPFNKGVGAIPLRLGYFQNFETIVKDACFENSAIQPGEWVELLFFSEDRMDSNPAQVLVQTSTVELGFARGELDGLTRQVYFEWEFQKGCLRVYDIENQSFNTGVTSHTVTSVGTFNRTGMFQIPSGFQGKILGSELIVNSASDVGGPFEIHAVPSGFAYTDDVTGVFPSENALCFLSDVTSVIDAGEYNSRPLVSPLSSPKGIAREGIILDEGEIPLFIFTEGIGQIQGRISGFLLIRLSPKAEA